MPRNKTKDAKSNWRQTINMKKKKERHDFRILASKKSIWQPWIIDLALTGMAKRIRVSVEAAWVHFTLNLGKNGKSE